MKHRYLILILFLLGMSWSTGQAQDVRNSRRAGVRFGWNIGYAWQTSDVRTIGGWGTGATLEVPLVENTTSGLGLSLRGRYLWSNTFGRDYTRSYGVLNNSAINGIGDPGVNYTGLGYYYANHRTRAHNWDLELMFKANRLRARTGILAYVWGGLGVMGYRTNIDQFDFFSTYDYSQIDESETKEEILSDLWFMRNQRYDSPGEAFRFRHWVFTPSLGVGLGYEFNPWFSMVFEYKVSFPFTDLLDAQRWDDNNQLTGNNDIHHYGGLGLNLAIVGRAEGRPTPRPNSNYTPSGNAPGITVLTPAAANPIFGPECRTSYRVRLFHVNNKSDIKLYHNGALVPPAFYAYDPSQGILSGTADLRPGENRFRVVATNRYGTRSQEFTASCQLNQVVPPQGAPPEVYITYPTGCPSVIAGCRTMVYAEVYGIRSKNDLTVYHYGQVVPPANYDYNPYGNQFSMDLQMYPGDNRFEIVARNPYGQDRAVTVVRCPSQAQLPSVNITRPSVSPFASVNCSQQVVATVTGVTRKNEIQVYLDGGRLQDNQWAFNAARREVSLTVNMIEGRDYVVEIFAINAQGQAADIQVLRCDVQLPPPVVQIITPPGASYEGEDCNQRVVAKVLNVSGIQDITVYNGNRVVSPTSYSYNAFNQLLVMDVTLTPSVLTTFQISATNQVGTARANVSLRCAQEQVINMITICHIPPGNPADVRTITIPEDQWNLHASHGDQRGPCSTSNVTICFQGETMTISSSALQAFQNLGATTGPCVEPMIEICHVPPRNPAGSATIQIRASEWPDHQAHGDLRGPCSPKMVTLCYQGNDLTVTESVRDIYLNMGATDGPCPRVKNITICHIPPGNPANPQTITIPENAWAAHQAHGDISGPCSTNMITICVDGQNMTVSESVWAVYQGMGATQGPCPQEQMTICHIPPGNPANPQTLTIAPNAWPAHQAHGDVAGPCSRTRIQICYEGKTLTISESAWGVYQGLGATQGPCPKEKEITICHIPPGNPANPQTIVISENAWPAHAAHGDVQGPCSRTNITICYNGQTLTISESAWTAYQELGATRGPCPSTDITICHIPPGNPTNPQTLTISQNAWAAHQAHGDVQGACSDKKVTGCFQGELVSVSATVWPYLESQGAVRGPCPQNEITICHIPPGNPDGLTTMSIPENEWATHRLHGDTRGACNMEQITICIDGAERQIATSAWPAYQKQGATRGPCPVREIKICHIPPGNPANPQTITIPENAWAAHQAHGDVQGACLDRKMTVCYEGQEISVSVSAWDALQALGATRGPCPVNEISICHIPPGNPAQARTLNIPQNAWAAHQAHGDVQGPCSKNQVTVCLNGNNVQISETILQAVLGMGATQGPCPVPDITICHIPPGNPANAQTLTIPQNAWAAHQGHGDVQGACSNTKVQVCYNGNTIQVSQNILQAVLGMGATQGPCPVPDITICHIPPGNPAQAQTLTIPQNAWVAHQGHGDVQGACSNTKVQVCYKGNTIQVSQNILQAVLGMGATQGPCPEPDITICHIPPGNPAQAQTLTIPQNAWPAHQGHGDVQGACSNTKVEVCIDGNTIQVSQNILQAVLAMGATQGPCPVAQITICHIPPGNVVNPQNIQIPQNAWAAHQAHGDHQGPCSTQMITICHKPPGNPNNAQTIQISQSAWEAHRDRHGDTQGPCPTPTPNKGNGGNNNGGNGNNGGAGKVQGATKPTPEVKKITICHTPPGKPNEKVTMQVTNKEWLQHKKHGDKLGPCGKNTTKIAR